jgi:DivIVA domain-containing protein
MEITPRELRDVEIRESFRGYSRDEVNELLERAAATIDAANERMQQLSERISAAQSETGHTRETEDILHRTLLLAQRAADEAVGEATAKSRQMLDDAEMQSRRLIADAEADARRRGETERRRLEEEVIDLAGRRDALLADVEALTRFETDYRDRMARALEADLTALRSRPAASPGTRPEPSEVEIPVVSESYARREPETPPGSSFAPPPASPTSPATPPTPATPTPSYASPSASAPSETDVTSHEASTQAIDIQELFDRANANANPSSSSALAFEQPSAGTTTATTPSDTGSTPVVGGDAMEAEVLDDDAFFATLREAVHDETPLGPRDDLSGEDMFFDAEAESTGFRDVFRRRR